MMTTASLLCMGVLITSSDVAYSEITRIVMESSAYLLGPSLKEEEEEVELVMNTDNRQRS